MEPEILAYYFLWFKGLADVLCTGSFVQVKLCIYRLITGFSRVYSHRKKEKPLYSVLTISIPLLLPDIGTRSMSSFHAYPLHSIF